jgi:hypothetical protein
VALAILPHQWLSTAWPAFDRLFDPFCLTVGQTAGHSMIFGLLGLALLAAVPALRQRPAVYLGLLLGVGLIQEYGQLLFKARRPGGDELHDLVVDLIAGGSVWLVVWVIRRGVGMLRRRRGQAAG